MIFPRPSTRGASCATTRSTSASTPTRSISRWRREADQPRKVEVVKVAPPPQPITAPRQGFKLTSGLLVAVILSLIVVGFVGYVALQLVRFSQNPDIALTGPSVRRLTPNATSVVLEGTAAPNARITATGAAELERNTTADAAGAWTIEMPVGKGRNDFVVTSTDLETGRDSVGLQVIADVPVGSVVDPDARPTPALPSGASSESLGGTPTAQVAIAQPKNKATARNGVVKLRGTSDAPSVLVSFQWLGDADAAPPAPDPVELEVVEGTVQGVIHAPEGALAGLGCGTRRRLHDEPRSRRSTRTSSRRSRRSMARLVSPSSPTASCPQRPA